MDYPIKFINEFEKNGKYKEFVNNSCLFLISFGKVIILNIKNKEIYDLYLSAINTLENQLNAFKVMNKLNKNIERF